jgi:hypothetical protein
MTAASFVFVLAIGAAAIALWIAVRLPRFGPANLPRALLHVLLSVVVASAMTRAIAAVVGVWVPAGEFVAVFGIALPALTYMFLSAAWLMRAMRDFLQHPRL